MGRPRLNKKRFNDARGVTGILPSESPRGSPDSQGRRGKYLTRSSTCLAPRIQGSLLRLAGLRVCMP